MVGEPWRRHGWGWLAWRWRRLERRLESWRVERRLESKRLERQLERLAWRLVAWRLVAWRRLERLGLVESRLAWRLVGLGLARLVLQFLVRPQHQPLLRLSGGLSLLRLPLCTLRAGRLRPRSTARGRTTASAVFGLGPGAGPVLVLLRQPEGLL